MVCNVDSALAYNAVEILYEQAVCHFQKQVNKFFEDYLPNGKAEQLPEVTKRHIFYQSITHQTNPLFRAKLLEEEGALTLQVRKNVDEWYIPQEITPVSLKTCTLNGLEGIVQHPI